MTGLQQLNKDMLRNAKESDNGVCHGMDVFIEAIYQANVFNDAQPQNWASPMRIDIPRKHRKEKIVTVYFSWVTDNRLMAHIITDTDTDNPRLMRLCIPEAGYRLYGATIHKDGYQANGGGYSKPDHILDAMIWQAKKYINVNQDYIKARVIS